MKPLRRLVQTHLVVAAMVLAFALTLRVLVPAGYMPSASAGSLAIIPCDGFAPIKVSMPGMSHDMDKSQHQQTQAPCAFADLALPWLGSIDPVQLAAAIAFIVAAAYFAVSALRLRRDRHAWPPLRGPPKTA